MDIYSKTIRWPASTLALVSFALAIPAAAQGQDIELFRPDSPVGVKLQVQGGQEATLSFWPATFVFDGKDGDSCTATAVGPKVLLTAAHCIFADVGPGVIVRYSNKLKCWRNKQWNGGAARDVALCLTDKPIRLEQSAPYERIAPVSGEPALQRPVPMLGYGCTVQGGSTGVLYQGQSPVVRPPVPDRFFSTSGTVALCAGDSGGAAYLFNDTSRRIVGVAAMVSGKETSDFAATSDASVHAWIARWTKDRIDEGRAKEDLKICGIDQTLNSCHR